MGNTNKRRAWKIWQKEFTHFYRNLKVHVKIPKFNKCRSFNKAIGPLKNPKLINVGPAFIPDYREVCTLSKKSVSIFFLLLRKLRTAKRFHEGCLKDRMW